MAKEKKCNCGCDRTGPIMGHGLVRYCYNQKMAEYMRAKANKKTTAQTFKNYLKGTKRFVPPIPKVIEIDVPGQEINKLKNKLKTKTHNYVKDLYTFNDMIRCYTCENLFQRKDIDCGHFQDAGNHSATQFDDEWLRPQCHQCNRNFTGNKKIYEDKLRLEKGDKAVDEFKYRSYQVKKWSVQELEQRINIINLKQKKLSNERRQI